MSAFDEEAIARSSSQTAKRVEATKAACRRTADQLRRSREMIARATRSLRETAGIRPLISDTLVSKRSKRPTEAASPSPAPSPTVTESHLESSR